MLLGQLLCLLLGQRSLLLRLVLRLLQGLLLRLMKLLQLLMHCKLLHPLLRLLLLSETLHLLVALQVLHEILLGTHRGPTKSRMTTDCLPDAVGRARQVEMCCSGRTLRSRRGQLGRHMACGTLPLEVNAALGDCWGSTWGTHMRSRQGGKKNRVEVGSGGDLQFGRSQPHRSRIWKRTPALLMPRSRMLRSRADPANRCAKSAKGPASGSVGSTRTGTADA